ncbi:MAG: SURF1 family protein [Rubrivivax sp.]|jgi:surfeit locus 1 family protein|nr:SURF1 family protein [Rubrivivax sp.]
MTARDLVVLVATIAAVAATARLGLWQLDRAAQKQALQAALEERRRLPTLDTAGLAADPSEAEAQHHRAARVEGRWLATHTVYLENRQMEGRPGFFVVTPLLLADGSAVLVQRGWLPRDPADRTRVTAPPTPDGVVAVEGRIAPPPARLYEFDSAASGAIRQNLDVDAFSREIDRPLRPVSLVQQDAAGGEVPVDGLLRRWPAPAAGVHKHHGYAFQWFALAALVAGLYVWFQLVRRRHRPRT